MNRKVIVLGNGSDWCKLSLSDFESLPNVEIFNGSLPCDNKSLLGKLAKIHFSLKINKVIRLPLKKVWFDYFVSEMGASEEINPIFLFYDRNRLANNEEFLHYLKQRFPKCTLAYIFTNIAKISGASNNNFISKLKEFYDLVYAFDPSDSVKYGFLYSPLLYSKNDVNALENQAVFYVGRAKDRYQELMGIYRRLKKMNVSSKFYIFNVPEEQQLYKESIIYNKMIPYKQCLQYIVGSDCLIDVIQGESEGFTIKVCEAVFYDKLLITTNKKVLSAPFYDERFIKVIESPEDIDVSFFVNAKRVKYTEEQKAFFSCTNFLSRLENDACKIQ